MQARLLRRAMGSYDGDFLTIANKFAKVNIIQDGAEVRVTGDLEGKYRTVGAAVNAAVELLGKYQNGRADRYDR